jgi:uncharacterized protein (DUF302 family)
MSQRTEYGMCRSLELEFPLAVERVVTALAAEGFGVLTTIDVRSTLKEKLGVDFQRYVILGACNPQLAHSALGAEIDIGLLLPCNVVVREEHGETTVAIADPEAMLEIAGNPALAPIAHEARQRLARVLARLGHEPADEVC